MWAARGGELVHVYRDDMVRDQIADVIEPERGQLRENFALVGTSGSEDVIEGGDAIGGDDEQVRAEIVDVANLAAPRERQTVELGFKDN